jgi:hypothetical protein
MHMHMIYTCNVYMHYIYIYYIYIYVHMNLQPIGRACVQILGSGFCAQDHGRRDGSPVKSACCLSSILNIYTRLQ